LMPYMRYSRKVWERVKNENPQLKLWEVGRIIGQMWRELPDEEKNAYIEEYEAEKLPYSEAMRQYHSSPAYQAWIVAKERGILLDPDEQFTVKHVAAARFQRNHRLMQEILSDAKLPDPGQLITKTRLYTLRMQVKQLKNHKKNLCSEIENCELRHQAKMRRIADESAAFYADYRKLLAAKPRITEAQFSEMIIKAKHDLAREEEEKRELQLLEAENPQQQVQQQAIQQPLSAQSPHLQQQPNPLKQGDFSRKVAEASSPLLTGQNDLVCFPKFVFFSRSNYFCYAVFELLSFYTIYFSKKLTFPYP
uniref:HMG box domain-containing protein n=1 Tax=Schistocephalus solidus TaxID=70667 RepID=A0A183TP08_SCHSO